MEQHLGQIISVIAVIFAVLWGGFFDGGSSSGASAPAVVVDNPSGAQDPTSWIPVVPNSTMYRDGYGNVIVDGVHVGESLENIRYRVDGWPEDSRLVHVEDGSVRREYSFGGSRYFFTISKTNDFAADTLVEIRVEATPENVQAGQPLTYAREAYGSALRAFVNNSTNRRYAVFTDEPGVNTQWIVGYDQATQRITTISIALASTSTSDTMSKTNPAFQWPGSSWLSKVLSS